MNFLPHIALPVAIVLIATPVLAWLAKRIGFIDLPDTRKRHDLPTPLAGGASIMLAVGLTALLTKDYWPGYGWGLIAGMLLMVVIGTIDDKFPIRARYRFVAQLVAAGVAVAMGGTILQVLGDVFTPTAIGLGMLAIPITIVSIVGLINAFNMADGCDGLCGGYSAIAMTLFLISAFLIDNPGNDIQAVKDIGPIIVPFIAALVTMLLFFTLRLPWRKRAKVFLGDGGSMALGFCVGWVAVRMSNGWAYTDSMPAVVALWIVALPLFDMFACLVRRMVVEGVTPMHSDRKHLHHTLMAMGYSHRTTVHLLHAVAAAIGLLGIVGWQAGIPQYLMFWGLFVLLLVYIRWHIGFWRESSQPANRAKAAAKAVNAASSDEPTTQAGS